MSADVDHEDKTEEPTEKRLHDAVEKGQTAFSREAPLFASLSAALVALVFVVPGRSALLFAGLVGILDDPAGWRITRGEDALALAGPLAASAAAFLWPVVALLALAGVIASVAQAAPRIVPDRVMPDFSRISPRAGLRRAFGARGLVEFAKSLIKVGAVGCVAGMMLIGQRGVLLTAMDDDPARLAATHPGTGSQDDRGGSGRDPCGRGRRPRLVAPPVAPRQPDEQARGQGRAQAGRRRSDDQGAPPVAQARPLAQEDAVGRAACDHGRGQSDPLRGRDALRAQRRGAPVVLAKGVDLIALKISRNSRGA